MELDTSILQIDETIYVRIPAAFVKFLNIEPTKGARIAETGRKNELTLVLPQK